MNQNRLFEGKWAIVSTYNSGETAGVSEVNLLLTALSCAEYGVPVELLQGQWKGQREKSLMLYGNYAASTAQEIAIRCSQETYIKASGNGTAQLCNAHGDVLREFTEMHEITGETPDDYSETGHGFRFRLV